MLFSLLQVAGESGAAPQQEVVSYSLLEMAAKGGWLMLVLLALSIIAFYIFGKKWWMIRKASKVDRNFMRIINEMLHDGKSRSAIRFCRK